MIPATPLKEISLHFFVNHLNALVLHAERAGGVFYIHE